MKRFYKTVTVAAGNRILLDGRPVKTPGRADLAAPTLGLAEAIAAEWSGQGEEIDPRAMAHDRPCQRGDRPDRAEREAFAHGLAAYGESDLLCYRAEGPAPLVARQVAALGPDPRLGALALRRRVRDRVGGDATRSSRRRRSTGFATRCSPATPSRLPASPIW